jgi:hypothetical protein
MSDTSVDFEAVQQDELDAFARVVSARLAGAPGIHPQAARRRDRRRSEPELIPTASEQFCRV